MGKLTMGKLNRAIDRAFVIPPSKRGEPWNIAALEKIHKGMTYIDDIPATTNEPLIWDNNYILGTSTTFAELNNVTDETRYTNKTKEDKMNNVLNIEVGATLINNIPSSKLTENQIIDLIKGENDKIEALKSVTTESVNINGKIEVCKINIELLIDILDEDIVE